MKTTIIVSLLIAFLAIQTAPVSAESELDAFKKAIRVQYDLKEKGFATNNADLIVDEFYSEDVVSVGPDGVPHIGREALRPLYKEVVKDSVKIESIKTHVEGNSGWDWTNFYVTPSDPKAEPFSFIILFLLQKRGEKWWSTGDIYVVGKLN